MVVGFLPLKHYSNTHYKFEYVNKYIKITELLWGIKGMCTRLFKFSLYLPVVVYVIFDADGREGVGGGTLGRGG